MKIITREQVEIDLQKATRDLHHLKVVYGQRSTEANRAQLDRAKVHFSRLYLLDLKMRRQGLAVDTIEA